MRQCLPAFFFASLPLVVAAPVASAEDPHRTLWERRFDTGVREFGRDLAVLDDDSVVIGGETLSTIVASPDALVARYDRLGQLVWTREFGDAWITESVQGVASLVDGGVLVAGTSGGTYFGASAGANDAFLAKLGSDGSLVWSTQIGSVRADSCEDVSVSGASSYIVGGTEGNLARPSSGGWDAYVARHHSDGQLLWIRQVGTSSDDRAYAAAPAPDGGVYVGGVTSGVLGGPSRGGEDAFIVRFSLGGEVLWTRQFGSTANDRLLGLGVDAMGNVLACGSMVAKFDEHGNQVWYRGLGGVPLFEPIAVNTHIAADAAGRVLVSAMAMGSVMGNPSAGAFEAVLLGFDSAGALGWARQFGGAPFQSGEGVAVDSNGLAYLLYSREYAVPGSNPNSSDSVLVKLGPPCSPDMTFTAVTGAVGYGEPDGVVTNDDFFYYLIQYVAGNLGVADRTTTAVPGQPGYGVPNGVINNDDFFFYLTEFVAGC